MEYNVMKMEPNPVDPNLPPLSKSCKQTKQPNHLKISGCKMIAHSNLFFLEKL